MLGHVELSTTQIYTQVSIRQLKAVHALTHPSAKLERPTPIERPALTKTTVSAEELFAHLAAEDDEAASDDVTAPSEAALHGAVAPPARRSRSGQHRA
jgi:integrase/recombinase XerD